MIDLAIVIPAYKRQYLEATLLSISRQTDKDFVVYIGDDNSPDNLQETVGRFNQSLCIVYKRFEENLGLSNLVLQWERCVAMVGDEKWVWLFSDDDLMDENCVSKFRDAVLTTKSGYDLYRFNSNIINDKGNVVQNNLLHPPIQSVHQFAIDRLELKTASYAVEYIFSKKKYLESGKFVNFPLAWCSDDATWINIGFNKGIFTIPGAYVNWRYSFTNISSLSGFSREKIEASLQYIAWLKKWLVTHSSSNIDLNSFEAAKFNWLKHQVKILGQNFGVTEGYKYARLFNHRLLIPIRASLLFFLELRVDNLLQKLKSKLRRRQKN
jgi:glycosyltransferase involved in cell wall biosynthesis